MENQAEKIIMELGLAPHPEGGYYKNTFQSEEMVEAFGTSRKQFTSIYFLLKSGEVSHFHRLKSDEVWYFHSGSSLTIHTIDEEGRYGEIKLGMDVANGERPQAIVRKNTIFGSSVTDENTYALVGCMVSPGFDFEDFELFTEKELLDMYPAHQQAIELLGLKEKEE